MIAERGRRAIAVVFYFVQPVRAGGHGLADRGRQNGRCADLFNPTGLVTLKVDLDADQPCVKGRLQCLGMMRSTLLFCLSLAWLVLVAGAIGFVLGHWW